MEMLERVLNRPLSFPRDLGFCHTMYKAKMKRGGPESWWSQRDKKAKIIMTSITCIKGHTTKKRKCSRNKPPTLYAKAEGSII